MTISEITCDLCKNVIGYTNKKIPAVPYDWLDSDKLTNAQKLAFMRRKKFLTCVSCHKKEMAKAMKEVRRDNERVHTRFIKS